MNINLQEIDTIIFDFGGVILDIDPQKTANAFAKLLNIGSANGFADSPLFKEYELGLYSSEEFRDQIRALTNSNLSDNDIDNAWNAMLLDYHQERIDKIKELKSAHHLILLSNTNAIHFNSFSAKLKEEFNLTFHDLFGHVFLSHELNLAKPNIEIYEHVIKKAGLKPERTLFIEDTAENLPTAEEAGIKTLLIERNQHFFNWL
jgi:putative hydrolase of the HAD superfamily